MDALPSSWQLWAHLPHDTNWKEASYKLLGGVDTVGSAAALCHALPDQMVRNCMLFLMRGSVKPMWEDPANRRGGAFSYRVPNRIIPQTWKTLMYKVMGETLDASASALDVAGITISPKKTFCVVKIWTKTSDNTDPGRFTVTPGLEPKECMFKKHDPQF